MRVQIAILSCLLSVVILQFYLIGIFSITDGFDKNASPIYLFTEIYTSHMVIFLIFFRKQVFVFWWGVMTCLWNVIWYGYNRYRLSSGKYSWTFHIHVSIPLKIMASKIVIMIFQDFLLTFIQQHLKSLAAIERITKAPKQNIKIWIDWLSESMSSMTLHL